MLLPIMLCIISSAKHSQGVNALHTDYKVLLELKPYVRVDASKYLPLRPLKDMDSVANQIPCATQV